MFSNQLKGACYYHLQRDPSTQSQDFDACILRSSCLGSRAAAVPAKQPVELPRKYVCTCDWGISRTVLLCRLFTLRTGDEAGKDLSKYSGET